MSSGPVTRPGAGLLSLETSSIDSLLTMFCLSPLLTRFCFEWIEELKVEDWCVIGNLEIYGTELIALLASSELLYRRLSSSLF